MFAQVLAGFEYMPGQTLEILRHAPLSSILSANGSVKSSLPKDDLICRIAWGLCRGCAFCNVADSHSRISLAAALNRPSVPLFPHKNA